MGLLTVELIEVLHLLFEHQLSQILPRPLWHVWFIGLLLGSLVVLGTVTTKHLFVGLLGKQIVNWARDVLRVGTEPDALSSRSKVRNHQATPHSSAELRLLRLATQQRKYAGEVEQTLDRPKAAILLLSSAQSGVKSDDADSGLKQSLSRVLELTSFHVPDYKQTVVLAEIAQRAFSEMLPLWPFERIAKITVAILVTLKYVGLRGNGNNLVILASNLKISRQDHTPYRVDSRREEQGSIKRVRTG